MVSFFFFNKLVFDLYFCISMNKGCVQIFSFIILIEHDFNVYRINAYSMVLAKLNFTLVVYWGEDGPPIFYFFFILL